MIEIRNKKLLPIITIAGSCFILGTSFVIGVSINTLTGVILLILGILLLVNPAAVITKDEIQVRNVLGMTVKKHPYKPDEVSVTRAGISINNKKIVASWWADYDLQQVTDFINNQPSDS
ncbi:MAG: hypothetical protein MJB14_20835 [Spirochaetes bacterium]|nr:hypothetical protein [Spirochaetota bacterium]